MSGVARQRTLAARLVRGLLAGLAVVVIGLALALGTFRLLLARLPAYQAELKAWVDETLGVTLTFDRLDVHLGLRGPELTFHAVTVAADERTAPFLVAERAAVVVDPWTALSQRQLRVARLRFDGTELTVERGADGVLRLRGAPEGQARLDLAALLPDDVDVAVRDSDVVYVDRRQTVEWSFADVSLGMRRRDDVLQLEATAEPPQGLGRRIEIAAQQALDGPDAAASWRLFGEIDGVDLAELTAAAPEWSSAPLRGTGDVTVWLEWDGQRFDRGMLNAELVQLSLGAVAGPAPVGYDELAVAAEWQRQPDGWRLLVDEIDVTRDGRVWPPAGNTMLVVASDSVTLRSDFLRLEDLTPVVAALPQSNATLRWLELGPRGDLSDVDVSLARSPDEALQYQVAAVFDRLGLDSWGRWPGFDGASGALRADSTSGRVELDTHTAAVRWPRLFRAPLDVAELSGLIVWREGFDAVRVVSDDLVLRSSDAGTRSNLELTLPLDGSSPQLDLQLTLEAMPIVAAKRYLPAHAMPPRAVAWLDDALKGGRVTGGTVELVGPLRRFPFDAGEGLFRAALEVEDGVLEFVDGWPEAAELDGTLDFNNAAFAARGSGRVLGNASEAVEVGIADLRNAVLTVRGATAGPLADVLRFLNESPLIARYLGPGYARLDAPAGTGHVGLDLALPLRDMSAYELSASLDIVGGVLAIDGFGPRASDVNGRLTLADGGVSGTGIEAVFLDGPVRATVSPAERPGYRARLDVEGEVTADAAAGAFALPIADYVAGQTRWRGTLSIPTQTEAGTSAAPLQIAVESNLSGVALNFPPPLDKAPAAATTLQVDFTLDGDALDVEGHLGASRRFTLDFVSTDGGFAFERGAVRFGGRVPSMPLSPGLTVDGALPALDVDEWLEFAGSLGGGSGAAGTRPGFASALRAAELDIAGLSGFGQQLGRTHLNARRGEVDWLIHVDSQPIAGSITLPIDVRPRATIQARLQRLHLEPGAGGSFGSVDPRRLLGLELSAESFSYGARRLGRLEADVRADPVGLRLVSFEAASDALTIEGSGGWFEGPDGPTTRLAFDLRATDVATALQQLALDPIAEGGLAEMTGSVFWPGAPAADWTQHLSGDMSLRLGTGSLLDIDPGAGRVVGLMSISALPRRLALDFRDVFGRGLSFDEIAGDFVIIDGNAFTDNLKVTGPVAEIGVAGRIGLRDRDYRQQAVVTAEPGNMLPAVGAVIGGPGVGAALLIFTRIFKEPLKGIGRASYCVTGSWDQPVVERLSAEQLERGHLCAELPDAGDPAGRASDGGTIG